MEFLAEIMVRLRIKPIFKIKNESINYVLMVNFGWTCMIIDIKMLNRKPKPKKKQHVNSVFS